MILDHITALYQAKTLKSMIDTGKDFLQYEGEGFDIKRGEKRNPQSKLNTIVVYKKQK